MNGAQTAGTCPLLVAVHVSWTTESSLRRAAHHADSHDKVLEIIREAIYLHIDGMREESLPIPELSSFSAAVDM